MGRRSRSSRLHNQPGVRRGQYSPEGASASLSEFDQLLGLTPNADDAPATRVQQTEHSPVKDSPAPQEQTPPTVPQLVDRPSVASPVAQSARPLTRREMTAARRAAEAASDSDPAAAPMMFSPTAAPLPTPAPPAPVSLPKPTARTLPPLKRVQPLKAPSRRLSKRSGALASVAALALLPGFLLTVPANAQIDGDARASPRVVSDSHGRTAAQILLVDATVDQPSVEADSYVAGALAGIVATEGGVDSETATRAITKGLQASGKRRRIVRTALTYLGDPYVLDGASHDGIDCSGLTMMAYASVGIQLQHLVSLQDAVGHVVSGREALPGDLVVFDDHEHIGVYLGGGMLIQAPAPGRPVNIESVWSGVSHHFTRVLN